MPLLESTKGTLSDSVQRVLPQDAKADGDGPAHALNDREGREVGALEDAGRDAGHFTDHARQEILGF